MIDSWYYLEPDDESEIHFSEKHILAMSDSQLADVYIRTNSDQLLREMVVRLFMSRVNNSVVEQFNVEVLK